MATREFGAFGPRSGKYDQGTFDGTGADLRRAFSDDMDEGDRRMRELVERMRQIEQRPAAAANPHQA